MAYILRDTDGDKVRARHQTGRDALLSAKGMTRRRGAIIDVWWANDAGVAKVRLCATMIIDGALHVSWTHEGMQARQRGEI